MNKIMMNCSKCGISESKNDNETAKYNYRIQVGLFRLYNNANNLQMQLIEEGYVADIVRQGDLYAVHVGGFQELDDAVELERVLRFKGYNTLLVSV